MSEIITTRLLTDLEETIPMDRAEFYEQQTKVFKETGKPTRSVEIVQILIFTPDGELIVQKRSGSKAHNPGLMDKTIGGHIRFHDTPTFTVMTETLQELSVPAFVLDKTDDFEKMYALLKDYINSTALIQNIDLRTANFIKIINNEEVTIANTYHFYIGVYGGALRPADKEAAGVLFYKLPALETEMRQAQNLFTDDLRFFLQRYSAEINTFLQLLAAKS